MRLYGLTGGIASGKSTVSRMFRDKGMPLIDADVIARELVRKGQPALDEIARRFPGVVTADGELDRSALSARVFTSSAERKALEAITHPRIRQEVARQTQVLEESGAQRALYDAPLMVENRLHEGLAGLIVVVVPRNVQKARLMARNGLGETEADARINAQMPLDEKRKFATWVIDNGGTLEATQQQVDSVWDDLLARERAE